MTIWAPTCELRFVERLVKPEKPDAYHLTMPIRIRILQQKFVEAGALPVDRWMRPLAEWRDIPLVNEGEKHEHE